MNRKVLETIEQYRLIEQGDSVCTALSGGADSVALLCFLREHRQELGIRALSACHLNHCLRGEESLRDETFVRELCARWEIPLTVRTLSIGTMAKEQGLSVEECGRRERYRLFRELAEQEGCLIATAHTLSDSVETVLFNLARGTGLRGLRGIPARRDEVIRPLLRCTRQDIEDYCAAHDLAYVTDSTNLTDDYSRNRIRHQVIPVLRTVNPALEEAVLRMMISAEEADGLIGRLAEQAVQELARPDGWDGPGLLALEPAVAHRAMCRILGDSLSARHWELVRELLAQGRGSVELSGRCILKVRGDRFRLEAPPEAKTPHENFSSEVILPLPGKEVQLSLPDGRSLILTGLECEQTEKFIGNIGRDLKNVLDYDRIYGTVVVRHKMTGDSLRMAERHCTKTLKKLYNEQAVPLPVRDRLAVLADEKGVLWAEGFGCHQRAAADETSRRLIRVRTEPTLFGSASPNGAESSQLSAERKA